MNTVIHNPYIGPRTFKEEEGHLFFGRDREARDLAALVASEKLVLFYAQSGAGKSSLVNTRLIPELKQKDFEVLPVGRVSGYAAHAIAMDNIYIYNLYRSLLSHETDDALLCSLSLYQFLDKLNEDDKGYFYDTSLTVPIRSNPEIVPWPRALIIDQFEEIFSTNVEAWRKREDFFCQLAEAMRADPYLWVILVMREDHIAALDPYAHLLPGGLRVRYYMQRLSHDAAIQAVRSPVGNLRPYAPGVAEKLVDDLSSINVQKPDGTMSVQAGQYIEPVQMQVVCYSLWEGLSEGSEITEQDLLEVGDVNESLGKYYGRRVHDVAEAKNVKERQIREWFEKKLITAGGIRNMVLQEREPRPGELDNDVIQALQSDLVRAEKRGGATWYELTHDRLVEPILESNKHWFGEHLSPLQRQAAIWNDQGRNETWLLSDQALIEVEQWAREHPGELTKIETEFLEECRARQNKQKYELESQQQKLIEEQKIIRQRRRITYLSVAVAIVTCFLGGMVLYLITQSQTETKIAQSKFLSAQSDALRYRNPQLSALLGIEAYKKDKNIQSTGALLNTLLTNFELNKSLNENSAVLSVAFSPDGKTLASGNADQSIILWDAATGEAIGQPFRGHNDGATSIAFSPDGKILASGGCSQQRSDGACLKGDIILWDIEANSQIAQHISGHTDSVTSIAFSPDGKTLASGSADKTIILWNAATRTAIGEHLRGHNDGVTSIAFSPDGKTLASGSADKTIVLWNAATRTAIGEPLRGHNDGVTSIAFSPDGKTLASGSADKTIILWDSKSYIPISQPLSGHAGSVISVTFSPDGKTLASGSTDKTIILWDSKNYIPISQPLSGHAGSVMSVAFSPDSKTFASGGADKSIILWDFDPKSWIKKACQLAGRNFTNPEWKQYFSNEKKRDTCSKELLESVPTVSTITNSATTLITPTIMVMATIPALPTTFPSITYSAVSADVTNTPVPTATPTQSVIAPAMTAVPTATPLYHSVINVGGSDNLNMRAQPGYNYDIIGKIPNDAKVIQVIGVGVPADNTVWLPAVYQGTSGWIDSYYLSPSSFVGFNVYNVQLNGSGSEITVAPGKSVNVTYDFQVYSDPCPGCITQLVTGLKTEEGTPVEKGDPCAYYGGPGSFPGDSGSENITLTAPSTPGTYPVVVEYHWQYTCEDALANYGSGGNIPVHQPIGYITVR